MARAGILLILLLAGAFVQELHAQGATTSLSGRVVDTEGKPVPEAKVRLLRGPGPGTSGKGGVLARTAADAGGRFRLSITDPTSSPTPVTGRAFRLIATRPDGERFGVARVPTGRIGRTGTTVGEVVLDRQLLFGPELAGWRARRQGKEVRLHRGVVTAWRHLRSETSQTLYLELSDTDDVAAPFREPWELSARAGRLVTGGGFSVTVPEDVSIRYDEVGVLWAQGSGGVHQPPWTIEAFHPLRDGVGIPAFEVSGGAANGTYVRPEDGLEDEHVLTLLSGLAGEVPAVGSVLGGLQGLVQFLNLLSPPEDPDERVQIGSGGPDSLDPNAWDVVEGGWNGPSRSVVFRVPLEKVSGVPDTARAVLRASWAGGRANLSHSVPLLPGGQLRDAPSEDESEADADGGDTDEEETEKDTGEDEETDGERDEPTADFTHAYRLAASGADDSSLTVAPTGDQFAVGVGDSVRVWTSEGAEAVGAFAVPGDGSGVREIRFSPGGDRLALLSGDGLVEVRDLASGEVVASYPNPWVGSRLESVEAIGWSAGRRVLVAGTGKRGSTVVQVEKLDGERVAQVDYDRGASRSSSPVTFDPSGRWLAIGGRWTYQGIAREEMVIGFLRLDRGEVLELGLDQKTYGANEFAFGPRGDQLAWVDETIEFGPDPPNTPGGNPNYRTTGRALEVWDLESRSRLDSVALPNAHVRDVVVSPAGNRLAVVSGSDVEELSVWSLSGGPLARIASVDLTEIAGPVAFSRDGGLLATGAPRGGVVVWDATSGHRLGRVPGQEEKVAELAFVQGADQLVVVTEEGAVELYRRDRTGRKEERKR